MTANTTARTEAKVDFAQETGQYAVKAIGVLSALIGAWGMSCLIGGLASCGAIDLVKGYVSALTGM